MREWHETHMEKIVIKFVTGISENAAKWEKRRYKRYFTITSICRQVEYDIKHGVTKEKVLLLFQKIRNHSSFSGVMNTKGSMTHPSKYSLLLHNFYIHKQ